MARCSSRGNIETRNMTVKTREDRKEDGRGARGSLTTPRRAWALSEAHPVGSSRSRYLSARNDVKEARLPSVQVRGEAHALRGFLAPRGLGIDRIHTARHLGFMRIHKVTRSRRQSFRGRPHRRERCPVGSRQVVGGVKVWRAL